MPFFVRRIVIKNRAPFAEGIDLAFCDKSINVLSGINGKGKSTLLSYIMDAWVEITRDVFTTTYEDRPNKYYRISSPLYDIDSNKPSCVYIRFNNDGQDVDYVDVRNVHSKEEYVSLFPSVNLVSYDQIRHDIERNASSKKVSLKDSKKIQDIWLSNVVTFFSSYRHLLPNYLNQCYKEGVEYTTRSGFSDELPNPLEVKLDIRALVNWLMDVTIDAELYKRYKDTPRGKIDVTPENVLWDNVLGIVRSALISKYPDRNVRLAITKRANRGQRVSVTNNAGNVTYCPSVYNLSSGELEVLSIFCEILRQADRLVNNIPLGSISGIVLIDEIDLHLHIRLQNEVLPSLLNLFPNVQFIVTSHSPFLNMGLAAQAKNRSNIIDLDNGGIMTAPETSQQYEEVYKLMLGEKNRLAKDIQILRAEIQQTQKPIVVTEGKTDVKHIKKALEALGLEQRFDFLPEDKQPDGWSNVNALIENIVKTFVVGLPKKVIAIFDRDEGKLLKDYPDPYKELGNNVYALCIPCPQSRIDQNRVGISIEYFYSDDEIHSILPNGTHLFFGNEFKADSTRQHLIEKSLRANDKKGIGIDKIIENNGGQAVFDNEFVNHLAKKDEFANAIMNGDIVISPESWENFRPLFDIINEIIDK